MLDTVELRFVRMIQPNMIDKFINSCRLFAMAAVSMASKDKSTTSSKERDKEKEDGSAVIAGLQKLREQQKNIVVELSRVEEDKREHERVLEVLKPMEGDRKCYRMVGTTLVEHQISTVIPILETTLKNLDTLASSLKDNLVEKGKEMQEYTEKHNIHFVTEKGIGEQEEMTNNGTMKK